MTASICLACAAAVLACCAPSATDGEHAALSQAGARSGLPVEQGASPTDDARSTELRVAMGASNDQPNAERFNVEYSPWWFADTQGKRIETEHYVIHTTVARQWAQELLPRFCEEALTHYRTALAELPPPPQRLESYMLADRDQWRLKAQQVLPNAGQTYDNLGRGGLSTRGIALLYDIDYYGKPWDTLAITAHEGWHQYTQRTFKTHLPIWLEEGIAAYMEGLHVARDGTFRFEPRRNLERGRMLRSAVRRDRLIPLRELMRRTPAMFLKSSKDDLLIYYAQGWALCRFLVEGEQGRYRHKFAQLLTDAADGTLSERLSGQGAGSKAGGSVSRRGGALAAINAGPQIIRSYLNPDFDEFETQYLQFIERTTGSTVVDLQQKSVAARDAGVTGKIDANQTDTRSRKQQR